ncbi:tyrosine-type recombinase/integrase [Alteromonas sp. ASW11-19]|uniref:Tyrosine-type recombinase/integrase n=1 Tax=Alteromonas salexigens TaxID=2982530 RepID=A0ABT2VMW2_9ALTE|nr:tyrosine-type recombinase/integrase [Alteromonas salexigens]
MNRNLPQGMYYNKKGQTFYLRQATGGDVNLGKEQSEAIQKYYVLVENTLNSSTSVADMIHRYMLEVSPYRAETTHKTNVGRAKKLLDAFGDFDIAELKTRDIQSYLYYRRNTPIDANRTVALLRSMYGAAVRWGVIEHNENPAQNLQFHPENVSDRLVLMSELNAFKEFCPDWMKTYIDLKVCTGLRQSDMLRLSSENWKDKVGLFVQTSKTQYKTCFRAGKEFSALVENILDKANERGGREPHGKCHFFPNQNGRPYTPDGFRTMWYKSMQKALKSGKLKQSFKERDIRAMAATNCANLEDARRLMGHSSATTTLRSYRKGYEDVMPNIKIDPKLL